MIKKGNTDIGAVYLGSTAISAIYKGATEIWSAGISYLGKFFARSTAGGTSIGNGIAKIKSLRGNSRVWNQLVNRQSIASQTINGITYTNNNDGTITLNGSTDSSNSALYFIFASPESKYLIIAKRSSVNNRIYFGNASGGKYDTNGNGLIATVNGTFGILVLANTVVDNVTITPQIFDLTKIYGADNEPSTVAEFLKSYPLDYYDYCAGRLLDFVSTPNNGGTLNGSRIESRNSNDVVIGSVKLPTPSTGNLILRSAGNVYDEVIGTKVIRRVGVRAYQSGDEDNPALLTDLTNTNYPLATPIEETIPAWSNTYQAENGGTETLLPANTSEPYTSEVWADILYKKQ